jgi:CubicO group peptidase (beta-lactamase class C family)
VADPDAKDRINAWHLLNGTSGLSRASYVDAPDDDDASLEGAPKASARAQPTAVVGTEFQGFHQNYTTLGLLIKVVSGQTCGEYLAPNLFQPLGMERSFTSRPQLRRRDGPRATTWSFDSLCRRAAALDPRPAGGVWTPRPKTWLTTWSSS